MPPIASMRLKRLEGLLDQFGQTVEDYDQEVEEDLRPYFAGTKECGRWVCITAHGDKYFFLPEFPDSGSAMSRAVEYANDDLFQEIPVAVVDLDTGRRYDADLTSAGWSLRN